MGEWEEYIDRIRRELGIPEEKWYEILDKLTIRDELLIMLIYEVRQLRNDIRAMGGYKPVPIPIPTPTPPAPVPPAPIPPAVQILKMLYILNVPLIPIKDDKISVDTTEDSVYTFDKDTEVIFITVYGADTRISFTGTTSENTHIYPDRTALLYTKPKQITRMWAKAVSGSGEIYITEFWVEKE